jgi:hypothetical protein
VGLVLKSVSSSFVTLFSYSSEFSTAVSNVYSLFMFQPFCHDTRPVSVTQCSVGNAV